MEREMSQRFSEVQRQTAIRVLSRYYRQRIQNNKDTQTEVDFYQKYLLKKEKIRELRLGHQKLERT